MTPIEQTEPAPDSEKKKALIRRARSAHAEFAAWQSAKVARLDTELAAAKARYEHHVTIAAAALPPDPDAPPATG
jgi:hypothetical protein